MNKKLINLPYKKINIVYVQRLVTPGPVSRMIRAVVCNTSESIVNCFNRDHSINLTPEIGKPLYPVKSAQIRLTLRLMQFRVEIQLRCFSQLHHNTIPLGAHVVE